MSKFKTFLITILFCSFFVNALQVKFPDKNGILVPSQTEFSYTNNDFIFSLRPYDIGGNSENIYSFGYNFRSDSMFEAGFFQNYFSQDNLKTPDPVVSLKLNFIDPYNVSGGFIGVLLDTDTNNYSSVFLMKGDIGFGYNFNGKTGGDAFFGGYDFTKNEPEKFFLMFNFKKMINSKLTLGLEFNGDNLSIYSRFNNDQYYNYFIGYVFDNDYSDKYSTINDNNFVLGVYSEF